MGLGNNTSEISALYEDLPAGEIEGDDMKDFMAKVTPSCRDILKHCRWAGFPINCLEVFSEIITDDGLCCSFNTIPQYLLNRQLDAQLSELKISGYNQSSINKTTFSDRKETEELKQVQKMEANKIKNEKANVNDLTALKRSGLRILRKGVRKGSKKRLALGKS
ncbi:hypothetical protein J437_LFUL013354 [Ladona fulva]|uniref:Uncharacterized protein n=1 Tax=Ladona fulva TaxID=123851 RepID=A0A8K0KEV2_LADFU|nr:hypothetical protein J437_LFUL013354 [Ladona fulva]